MPELKAYPKLVMIFVATVLSLASVMASIGIADSSVLTRIMLCQRVLESHHDKVL